MASVAVTRCKPGPMRHAQEAVLKPPLTTSLDDIEWRVVDEFTVYGRDPFDIVAALEEELGCSIFAS